MLTKNEAIEAMKLGKKVRHVNFMDGEWMTIENKGIVFEDGIKLLIDDFFRYRKETIWDNMYYIVEDTTPIEESIEVKEDKGFPNFDLPKAYSQWAKENNGSQLNGRDLRLFTFAYNLSKEENTLLKKQNEVLLTNLHRLYNLCLADLGKGFEDWDEAKEYKKAIVQCTK